MSPRPTTASSLSVGDLARRRGGRCIQRLDDLLLQLFARRDVAHAVHQNRERVPLAVFCFEITAQRTDAANVSALGVNATTKIGVFEAFIERPVDARDRQT